MRSEVSEERCLIKPWKNFTLRKNVEMVQNWGKEEAVDMPARVEWVERQIKD